MIDEQKPIVMIADDSPEALQLLTGVAGNVLSHQNWKIEGVSSESDARELISIHANTIRVAVVDLRLSKNPKQPEGPFVLHSLREVSPACFNILVSQKRRTAIEDALCTLRMQTDEFVDRIVSLMYIDTDPVSELTNALHAAREQYESS